MMMAGPSPHWQKEGKAHYMHLDVGQQGGTLGQPLYVRGDNVDDGGQLLSRKEGLEHGLLMLPPDGTTYLAFAAFISMLGVGNGRREGR